VRLGSRTLSASGIASIRWKPPVGATSVRVRYLGGITNVAATSRQVVVTAR
jgi:hypothetical protein